jgi:hypothetical protein
VHSVGFEPATFLPLVKTRLADCPLMRHCGGRRVEPMNVRLPGRDPTRFGPSHGADAGSRSASLGLVMLRMTSRRGNGAPGKREDSIEIRLSAKEPRWVLSLSSLLTHLP